MFDTISAREQSIIHLIKKTGDMLKDKKVQTRAVIGTRCFAPTLFLSLEYQILFFEIFVWRPKTKIARNNRNGQIPDDVCERLMVATVETWTVATTSVKKHERLVKKYLKKT